MEGIEEGLKLGIGDEKKQRMEVKYGYTKIKLILEFDMIMLFFNDGELFQ